MRRGRRSSAPPAATSERVASGMPSLAPLAATIRSQASAISSPPATAKPSIAAIRGLREARWAIPAKPRSPNQGDSPLTKAPRSIPAQKKPTAPVSKPNDSPSSPSSCSRAPATPAASAAFTALRTSGRLSVITSTFSRRSARTGSDRTAVSSALISGGSLVGKVQPIRLGNRGGGRARRLLQLALGRVCPLAERGAELANALAARACERGQAVGAEHERGDCGDEQQGDGVLDPHPRRLPRRSGRGRQAL